VPRHAGRQPARGLATTTSWTIREPAGARRVAGRVGTPRPLKALASNPGTKSPTVGMSGSAAEPVAAVTVGLPRCLTAARSLSLRDWIIRNKGVESAKMVCLLVEQLRAALMTKIPEDKAWSRSGKRRVLLDTNIWRYVVDHGAQGSLLRLARIGSYAVQIAPGVLYETLRLRDVSLRASLVRLMTNARFRRLMPEAYSESMEILREIERIRPGWLRDAPDLRFFHRLKKDWSRTMGGFWVRCERLPEREARFIGQSEGDLMEGAKAQAQAARKEMIDIGWKSNPPMDKTLAGFNFPVPGWRGDMVEAWRIDSLVSMTYGLAHQGHAYRDWIAPFVELDDGLLRSAAWGEFWLYAVDKSALPRQWLRWAHSFAQRFRKVTPGSPGDTQLSTYFVETDVVITADKALLEILEECRPYAPCKLPEGRLVPAGAAGVVELLRVLET
jgi:hypothetical protein